MEHVVPRSARWTYSDDLGEEDGEDRLHGSVDGGADEPHEDVGPLGDVQTQHAEERHVGNVFILQSQRTEPGSPPALFHQAQMDLIHFYCYYFLNLIVCRHPRGVNWIVKPEHRTCNKH